MRLVFKSKYRVGLVRAGRGLLDSAFVVHESGVGCALMFEKEEGEGKRVYVNKVANASLFFGFRSFHGKAFHVLAVGRLAQRPQTHSSGLRYDHSDVCNGDVVVWRLSVHTYCYEERNRDKGEGCHGSPRWKWK